MEIPGYYYDAEKKKYFKILKHGPSDSPYSKDNVKRLKLENERSSTALTREKPDYGSVSRFLHDRELGSVRQVIPRRGWESLLHFLRHRRTSMLQAPESARVTPLVTDLVVVDHPCECIGIAGATDRSVYIMDLWTDSMSAGELEKANHEQPIISLGRQHISDSRITSLAVRSFAAGAGTYIAATSLGHASGGVLAVIPYAHEYPSFGGRFPVMTDIFRLEETIFCCDWLRDSPEVIVGGERTVSIFHLESYIDRKYHIGGSDILSICGRAENSCLIGSRDGRVRLLDLNAPNNPQACAQTFQPGHKTSVCWLGTIDENFFVSSYMNGQIRLWDIRQSKSPVMSLHGHQNSHKMLKCAFFDDKSGLLAVGEDSILRAWSCRTGGLLFERKLRTQRSDDITPIIATCPTNHYHRGDFSSGVYIASGHILEHWAL